MRSSRQAFFKGAKRVEGLMNERKEEKSHAVSHPTLIYVIIYNVAAPGWFYSGSIRAVQDARCNSLHRLGKFSHS